MFRRACSGVYFAFWVTESDKSIIGQPIRGARREARARHQVARTRNVFCEPNLAAVGTFWLICRYTHICGGEGLSEDGDGVLLCRHIFNGFGSAVHMVMSIE